MSVAQHPAWISVPAELSRAAPASDMVQFDVDQRGADTPTLDRYQLTLHDSGGRQHALSNHAVLNSTPTMWPSTVLARVNTPTITQQT